MSTDGLSPPGTSTYSSNTLHVGDGTWDSSRDDFLLPNLQGLNFATMQYNGMGNRFRGQPQYHTLITGHAVIAAITFIGIVPTAALVARFYTANRRVAFKLHVYLQILTVFLSTVVLVLGWFAVGPDRSLTNPHHGIGVAIYTLIMFQFIFGWFMARRERKRDRPHPTIPLKVYLHKLLGRSIALLAFVQIALGLTLYGSPKALFALYALAGFFLLTLYLILSYRTLPRLDQGRARPPPTSDYYSDYDSYVTGQQTDYTEATGRQRKESHWGRNILAGAGAIGAYEWWKRRKDRGQNEKEDRYTQRPQRRQRPPGTPGATSTYGPSGVSGGPVTPSGMTGSRPPSRGSRYSRRDSRTDLSPQTWEDFSTEKYSERPKPHTWRDRLLGAGAGIAAFEGVKSIFGRNRQNDNRGRDRTDYRPPLGGNQNMVSQSDISRVEAGQAPFSPDDHRRNQRLPESDVTQMTPSRPPARRRPSLDSLSYDDQESVAPPRRRTANANVDPTLRDSIATMGAIAGFREWNKRRRDRREDQRAERIRRQELDTEEQFNRRNSDRYPRPQDANGRRDSMSGTIMTGPDQAASSHINSSRQNFRPDPSHPPLPAAAGDFPSASGAPTSTVGPSISRQNLSAPQQYNIPPPPPGPPPSSLRPGGLQIPEPGALQMPQGAINPDPSRLLAGRSPIQASSSHLGEAASAAAAGAGFAAGHSAASHSPTRIRSRDDSRVRFQQPEASSVSALPPSAGPAGSPGSPPVSLKVKMHNDGRHVTLRRLNEEEAEAERAAHRRDRRQQRRNSSLSSAMDDNDGAIGGPSQRYRRNGGGSGSIRPSSEQPITNIPPPPAMSNSALGGGSGNFRPPSDLNLPPHGSIGGSGLGSHPPPAPSSRFTASGNPVPGMAPASFASSQQAFSSPPPPQQLPAGLVPGGGAAGAGSGLGSMGGSPGAPGGTDLDTGTDVSAFDNNRRRRRAERARRAAAQGGNRVDFT